jgi:hypothetical protein
MLSHLGCLLPGMLIALNIGRTTFNLKLRSVAGADHAVQ